MRIAKLAADIIVFLLAAAVVYLVGATLLAAWPMWTMMGFRPSWILALLAVALAAGLGWALLRGKRQSVVETLAEGCPQCGAAVKDDYVLCPACHTALQTACPECRRSLKASWTRCPYCTAQVAERSAEDALVHGVTQGEVERDRSPDRALTEMGVSDDRR